MANSNRVVAHQPTSTQVHEVPKSSLNLVFGAIANHIVQQLWCWGSLLFFVYSF